MDKKGSRGVRILAWLLIILNALNILLSLDISKFFDIYKTFSKGAVIAIILYTLLSTILGVISGFGILKLKETMRRLAVIVNSLDVLLGIPLLFLSWDSYKQFAYSLAVAQAESGHNILSISALSDVTFKTIIVISLIYFVLSLLTVFFFTRPKVKEQFK